ncbi:MAG: gliding motility-associated C-terminal domain-containing protein [Bacteroidia bacterium]
MKKGLINMGLLLLFLPSFSQNLITNPSLDWRDCAALAIDDVEGWFSNKREFELPGTYFNGCIDDNVSFYVAPYKVMPYHGESYLRQAALEGRFDAPNPMMVGNELLNSPDSGFIYYFSNYALSHYNLRAKSIDLVDRVNVKFLEEKPDEKVWIVDQPFFGTYDLRFDGFRLKDTINWIKQGGFYKANGTEKFFVYGCFEPFDSLAFEFFHNPNNRTDGGVVQLLDAFTLIPVPTLPKDTVLCDGDTIKLKPKCPPNAYYEWYNGQKGGVLEITEPGTYWVMNYSKFDTVKQEIVVRLQGAKPQLPNVSLCGNDSIRFNVRNLYNGAKVNWFDNDTNTIRSFTNAGNYAYRADISGCVVFDTLTIKKIGAPKKLEPNYSFCITSPEFIYTNSASLDSIYWQGKKSVDSFTTTESAQVFRRVFIDSCEFMDSTSVTVYQPKLVSSIDTQLCLGNRIEFDFDTFNLLDIWPGYLSVQDTGIYQVGYYDGCDTSAFAINVAEKENCQCHIFIPTAFSPNNTAPNDSFYISVDCEVIEQNFEVYNRWGQQVYQSSESTIWSPTDMLLGVYYYKWTAVLNNEGERLNIFKYGTVLVLQ